MPILHENPFAATIGALPRPYDQERLTRGHERWRDEAKRLAEDAPDLAAAMRAAAEEGTPSRALLDAVFGNSPYLSTCLIREPAYAQRLLAEGPDAAWQAERASLREALFTETDPNRLMKGLRVGKRRMALAAALADIAGLWPLHKVTETLSDYADLSLHLCATHLLRVSAAEGNLELAYPDDPTTGSGLVILGMGKHGARELNFSSDIDIIVLFDTEIARYIGKKSPHEHFVRLTKSLVRFMEERTADGYVFRTDLRLRPDPGSTALALSTEAAETYYESFGQNWERAAMIKVRPVAGDIARGEEFVKHLRPFVWRKSLDFYAIQDIHSIKRQINAHKGGGRVAVAGHNIKLGRGGIREVEFFAQTQQLIWGGREPGMRERRTLDALQALVEHNHVEAKTAEELAEAYTFLRTLEHRLQMIEDAQTQIVPADDAKLDHIATFMGYPDAEAFKNDVRHRLVTVEGHYAHLFEDAPSLSEEGGNLVFTGGEDDPDTIATLGEMGFKNPQAIASTIRGWHHGRYRATRSTRAKEMLTELVPTLLRCLGRTANPDQAFLRFNDFLAKLPAGVQLFSMFHANPALLDLVAEIMGDAPRLAEVLSRKPNLLDAVLSPDFYDAPPDKAELGEELDKLLSTGQNYEDVLILCRMWASGRRFQVGVQTLRLLVDARQAGTALTAIADVVIDRLMTATEEEFVCVHGYIPGGGMAVVALGKMGGREMTATSDLDLITVYDAPAESEMSDGARPLSRTDYYIRLTQRLVNAITALTSEGRLYEVDLRLRPSGSKGPLAASLEAFAKYNAEAAWTWEHLALTRARPICGPPDLRDRVAQAIHDTLTHPRDPDKLLVDVADMRALMARERKPANLFDVKLVRGGLVDVEFITQYLLLRHASDHPQVLSPNVGEALAALKDAGALPAEDAEILLDAQGLWLSIQAILRHSLAGAFTEEDAPPGLREKLAAITREPSFDALKVRMEETYERVRAIFARLIEDPAEQARSRLKKD